MANNRNWKYAISKRGSTAVETLETAWEMLRRAHPRIPTAVLSFVDSRSRRRLRGYFARSTWRKRRGAAHEIAISPNLIGHPEDLLATMMHEAAHAVLYEAGENAGMGSTRYYHTAKFRDQCQAFGLVCKFLNTRYGWTLTSWPATGVPEPYRPIVVLLRRDLPAGTRGDVPLKVKARPLPPTGHTMLVCGCDGGERTIYVKKSVLEKGGVLCAFCGEAFQLPKLDVPAGQQVMR